MVLDEARASIDAAGLGSYFLDTNGKLPAEQVLAGSGVRMRAMPARDLEAPGEGAALWLRFRLARAAGQQQHWVLEIPAPLLDRATLYQQDSAGRWYAQSAGDHVAVANWPQPGRYPVFRLALPDGQARDIYLSIQHLTRATIPMQFTTEAVHQQEVQLEYLALGAVLGALLLLIAACLTQGWIYRDAVYGWYALYAGAISLAVAAYTGVAGHLLWSNSAYWNEAAKSTLAVLASAASLLFVRKLTGLATLRRADAAVLALGIAGVPLALLLNVLQGSASYVVLGGYVALALTVNLWVAWLSWRRGETSGQWLLLSYLPVSVTAMMSIVRLLGWLPVSFGTQYAVVAALALQLPLLLIALALRSRERHGAQTREMALSTQDALTGLLAPHLFHDRLQQVVKAAERHGRTDTAVVFIRLVNHGRIREVHGPAVAEHSLLRSVIKLRRLLRDVDTPSRIAEARFGLIMEGVNSRTVITDRMARLIAAGLMPLPGLNPEVTLQFHAAAVLLGERTMDADQLEEALDHLLDNMSSRTRRPIRFLEPAPGGESQASLASENPQGDPFAQANA